MGLKNAEQGSRSVFPNPLDNATARWNIGSSIRHKTCIWAFEFHRLHNMHAHTNYRLSELSCDDYIEGITRFRRGSSVARLG